MATDTGGALVKSLKYVSGVILSMIIILGAAAWAGDTRWVTNEKLERVIKTAEKNSERTANALRKQLLEDKIFELDQIPDREKTNIQRAVANRTRTQLQEVSAKSAEDR